MLAHGIDRLARHLHAVGPHVGDEADRIAVDLDPFVQALRDAHGLLRAEAKFPRRFLLQGGGGERRRRVALDAAPLDRVDGEIAGFDLGAGTIRQLGAVQVELIEPLAVQMRQPGGERGAGRGGEMRLDRPVLARPERLDLGFALADQPQCDRLHAPGTAAAGQLAPQHWRQGEADQIVQRPPRQVGLDQRLIELARVRHGVFDGGAGDLVEGDPLDPDALQGIFFVQHGADMPGDRLALAIRIGGEVQGLGAFQRLGDGRDLAVAALVGGPVHGEVLLRTHAPVLGRQVAHMPKARQHGKPATEVFVDCLGLGGRFDDDDVRHAILTKGATAPVLRVTPRDCQATLRRVRRSRGREAPTSPRRQRTGSGG